MGRRPSAASILWGPDMRGVLAHTDSRDRDSFRLGGNFQPPTSPKKEPFWPANPLPAPHVFAYQPRSTPLSTYVPSTPLYPQRVGRPPRGWAATNLSGADPSGLGPSLPQKDSGGCAEPRVSRVFWHFLG